MNSYEDYNHLEALADQYEESVWYIDVGALKHWRFPTRQAAERCAESWNQSPELVKELT